MADYVLLGLVVAVVVVGILLMSCWKNKPNSSENSSSSGSNEKIVYRDRDVPGQCTKVVVDAKIGPMGRALESGGRTGFGTAQENRDYNMRMDDIATDMGGYGSYNNVTTFVGLEPTVYQSHNQWIKDMNHTTSTASMQSERDDLGDLPNPWTGLRRPNFTDHPGIEASARQDASYTKDQMVQYRHFVI